MNGNIKRGRRQSTVPGGQISMSTMDTAAEHRPAAGEHTPHDAAPRTRHPARRPLAVTALGLLTTGLLTAGLAPTASAGTPSNPCSEITTTAIAGALKTCFESLPKPSRTVFVDAKTAGADGVFADSGIVLPPNLTVTVTGTGTASAEPGYNSGPNGVSKLCGGYASATNPCPLNSAPVESLIARVGDKAPVFIGAGPVKLTGPGRLTFAFNDPEKYFSDNSGGFNATVTLAIPFPAVSISAR